MSDHFDPEREAEAIGLPLGFHLRVPRLDDVPAVVTLLNAVERRVDGVAQSTEESMRHDWRDPDFDIARDHRLVLDGEGALVGYFYYYGESARNHPDLLGYIHPDAEGRGLGTAGLRWGVRHALERAEALPLGQRISAFTSARPTFAPGIALLEGFGMKEVRRTWRMVIELEGRALPEPQWPEGIALRPFERERDALALYRALDESFRDHWGYESAPSEEEGIATWAHWVLDYPTADHSTLFVAWGGDEIVGASLCNPHFEEDPGMAWLSQLAVRAAWRKRGLATALLHHTFGEFQWRGRARVGLGVDGENRSGATRLYERVGMRIARETAIYELELRPGYESASL